MPTITVTETTAYAHCPESTCPGNEQVQVPALLERSDRTFAEWSDQSGLPPVPGIENTVFRLAFAGEEDKTCEHCGRYRELSEQERPVYPSTMKFYEGNGDPHFLLKLAAKGAVHAPGSREAEERAAALRAEADAKRDDEVAELRRELAEMRGFVAGLAGKRGPGRPPKQPTED